MRLTLLWLAAFSLALGGAACSGPHSGKSERFKKPREKERPKDEEVAQEVTEAPLDTKCRTNFFADPVKRRRARDAVRITKAAEPILVEAEGAEGKEQIDLLVEAMDKLINALKKDPYGPLPTFKLAVAYALAGKQGCAVALLERLATLQQHPDVEREASRTVKRALKDPAFDRFRKEADKALGE